jgi:hypothetical protein
MRPTATTRRIEVLGGRWGAPDAGVEAALLAPGSAAEMRFATWVDRLPVENVIALLVDELHETLSHIQQGPLWMPLFPQALRVALGPLPRDPVLTLLPQQRQIRWRPSIPAETAGAAPSLWQRWFAAHPWLLAPYLAALDTLCTPEANHP